MSGKGNPRRANGHRRDQIRKRLKASGRPCALCGAPIDYAAPYLLDNGRVNPWCFVVDEVLPVSRGGDPLDIANCQPAHHLCNARAGDKRKAGGAEAPDAPAAVAIEAGARPVARSVEL